MGRSVELNLIDTEVMKEPTVSKTKQFTELYLETARKLITIHEFSKIAIIEYNAQAVRNEDPKYYGAFFSWLRNAKYTPTMIQLTIKANGKLSFARLAPKHNWKLLEEIVFEEDFKVIETKIKKHIVDRAREQFDLSKSRKTAFEQRERDTYERLKKRFENEDQN